MSVLVFLCFILFLIICVWNIYLTMQLSKFKEIEKSLFHIKQETEDVLFSFIEEWKEENEQFLNKLSNNSNNNKQAQKIPTFSKKESLVSTKTTQENRFDFIEKETEIDYKDLLLNENGMNKSADLKEKQAGSIEENLFTAEEITPVKSSNSLLEEIISMRKNGLTTSEIAKKLDKGKTEIELMLKLRQ